MPAGLITDWTIEEVQSWLGSVALGSLKSAFKERGINGTRMLSMGQEERDELGFTPRKSALFEKKLTAEAFQHDVYALEARVEQAVAMLNEGAQEILHMKNRTLVALANHQLNE